MINLLTDLGIMPSILAADLLLSFSLFDGLITITLLWAVWRGYKRGSIVHSVALLVLLGGVFLAALLSYQIYYVFSDIARVPLVHMPVIVFSVLFVGVVYGAHYTADKVTGNIGKEATGKTNKGLGVIVNIAKYLFMTSIVLTFIFKLDATYDLITPAEKKETSLYYPVLKIAPTVFRILKFPEINPVPSAKPIEYQDVLPGQEEVDDNLENPAFDEDL